MKKMLRKAISWIMLTLLLCPTLSVSASELNQKAQEGVVLVVNYTMEDGEMSGMSRGTGFFIGKEGEDPSYIITNYHVVEESEENSGKETENQLGVFYGDDDFENVYLEDYDIQRDIALLRTAKPASERIPLKLEKTNEKSVGMSVYAIGFPAVADSVDSVSAFGIKDSTVIGGTIGRLVTESSTGRRLIQTDAAIHGGNSGGPLVTEAGNVVGINTFEISKDGVKVEGMNYAVSIAEVIQMLNRNDVAFELVNADNDSNSVNGTAKAAEGETAAKTEEPNEKQDAAGEEDSQEKQTATKTDAASETENSQKAEETQETEASQEMETSSESEDDTDSINYILIISIGAGVLVAAAAAVIVARKLGQKKKNQKRQEAAKPEDLKPTQASPAAMSRQPSPEVMGRQPEMSAMLWSMASQHNRMCVPVDGRQIIIGRDPSCRIVFEPKTPGVSGRHCSILWDASGERFVLVDLGSTYGTYVKNGQKLAPNTPYYLQAGESFYLGQRSNEIKTEVRRNH